MPQRIDTTQTRRILGACDWSRKHGKVIPYTHIFEHNGISKSAGFRLLRRENGGQSRKPHYVLKKCPGGNSNKTNGTRKELTEEDVDQLIDYLKYGGFNARTLNYKQLVEAAGLDVNVSPRTVQAKLAKRGFKRYPATEVDELPEEEKKKRGMKV
ncbi:hypothetical protein Sste5346_006489 [Sporothrix stenoceras]|uniref:Uncharacterized protein n=1 Tax=Sporothrix stenoceras TaxID=5173 RepID=A0ABR3YZ56_9PEZI